MSKAPLALLLFASSLAGVAQAATFTGTVFEDVHYGGGAGRSLAASGGMPISGVRVEFYRANNNNYLGTASTNASGFFTFTTSGGNAGVAVIVRVVNGSVRSERAGGSGCTTCVPVQTFRTAGSGNGVTPVTNRVGGENPALSDGPANTASFTAIDDGGGIAQSITTVTPAGTNSTINGIDFGFNFDTIVNTRDPASCTASASSYPCQGSLRQFVINSNALGGEGSLAQAGGGQIDGVNTALPAGSESSIFMIPDGTANPGHHTGYASQLTGGVAVISLSSALTTITGTNTRLDATTQTVNIGNDNIGTLGSGGTVGVDAIPLPSFQRPEVQLNAASTVVTLQGGGGALIGFALRQGYVLVTGSGCLVRNNLVGMSASGASGASDSGGAAHGITFSGSSATVRNNFVTVNNSGIRTDGGGAGSVVTLNEVARPTSGHTNTFDGILLVGAVSNIQVTANLARDQQGGGIEIGFGGGAAASSIEVSNNTVRGNGFVNVGGGAASTEPIGMAAYDYTGNAVVFSRNVVRDNGGPGIMLMRATGTRLSQNVFMSNGGLSIDLDPRSIDPNTLGTPNGVTLNDNGDADAGPPNGLLNYPVITRSALVGGELTITGFARPNSAIELYVAQADPSGFGEGLVYLGTFLEGSAADLDTGTGAYGPAAINGVAQGADSTNRFSFRVTTPPGVAVGTVLTSTATVSGETSEFGGNVPVTAGPSLLITKAVTTVSDPVNIASNPKSIPGAVKQYSIQVTNQGAGAVDNDSVAIVDKIPPNTRLLLTDLGAPGSGPVAFINGSPSSALTWTYTALGNLADDLEFSNDDGATWNYVPVPDVTGVDPAVTDIRMRPKGLMPGQGVGSPSFQLRFRVRVN